MRPLDGVTVLELGQVISAPYAGLLLADLGATVIKVERSPGGDSSRDPAVTWMRGESATFMTFNRNKLSIALDLTRADDYESFLRLVGRADVVLTNLLPQAAKHLKVEPATLRAHNPRLVTCAISSFGFNDPESIKPSYDLTHQALTGFMMISGSEGDPPVRMGIPVADLAAGMFASYGILAALRARDVTGVGDDVDISMYACLMSLLTYQSTMYLTADIAPRRMGSAHDYVVPWQAFRTFDGWVVVAARANHFWVAICEAMHLPHLVEDPRFKRNGDRLEHRQELEALLAAEFITDTTQSWLARLAEAGVPAADVLTVPEALRRERERPDGLVRATPHPRLGELVTIANPVRFADLELAEHTRPPELDENHDLIASIGTTDEKERDDD